MSFYLQQLICLKQIVNDVFNGLPDTQRSSAIASGSDGRADLEEALVNVARERGLMAPKPWLERCLQLHSVAAVHQVSVSSDTLYEEMNS